MPRGSPRWVGSAGLRLSEGANVRYSAIFDDDPLATALLLLAQRR